MNQFKNLGVFAFLLSSFAGNSAAQSISIMSPSGNPTWSGWTGNQFTVSLGNAPNVAEVCYTVGAHAATNPGPPGVISGSLGALLDAGCSNAAPFSFPVNTFEWLNGPTQVIATAYDAAGNAVSTSAPATFTIKNSWPTTCTPQWTVTPPGTWSGVVTISATINGSCASDGFYWNFTVDGVSMATIGQPGSGGGAIGATQSATIDTTQWQNGPHNVGVIVQDTTNGSSYSTGSGGPGYIGGALEWTQTVTFANSIVGTGSEVRGSARDIYIAPTNTYTLTPTLIDTQGNPLSSPTFYYYDSNTSVATISGCTSGVCTGASTMVTGVANGSAQIYQMGATHSGTDGATAGSLQFALTSASYQFGTYNVGQLVTITGGNSNCIVGTYQVGHYESGLSAVYLVAPGTSTNTNFAMTTSTTGCDWSLGPTRTAYAQVWSTNNAVPCFSLNGGPIITGGYSPGCAPLLSMFGSSNELPAIAQAYPVPILTSWCNSGMNAIEASIVQNAASSWSGTQSAFSTAQTSYINGIAAQVGGCSKLRLYGVADNTTGGYLYNTVQGVGGGWSPTGMTTVFQALKSSSVPWLGVSTHDEIQDFGATPLQGPIQPTAAGTTQSWLISIAANGSGTCTVTTSTTTPGGYYSLFGGTFIITGSSPTGGLVSLNSGVGTSYTLTAVDSTHFTFPCAAATVAGNYNNSTDPGLTIQPWFSYANWEGSSYTNYDAWAAWMNDINAVSSRTPVGPSQAGGTSSSSVACWEGGPCGQSITVGGNVISSMADYADLYYTHPAQESYLAARLSLNSIINSNLGQGEYLRGFYGSYDPTKALITIGQGDSASYAFNSIHAYTVASCSGNTINFGEPHNITNLYPGLSRLTVSGSTGTTPCNGNYIILAAPTPTTVTVADAATSSAYTPYAKAAATATTGAMSITLSGTNTTAAVGAPINNNGLSIPAGTTISSVSTSGGNTIVGLSQATTGTINTGDNLDIPNATGATIHWQDGSTLSSLWEISTDGQSYPMGQGTNFFNYGTAFPASGNCGAPSGAVTRKRGQTFTLTGVAGNGASYFNGTTFYFNIENLSQVTSACQNYFREIPNFSGTGGSAQIIADNLMVRGRTPSDDGITAGDTDPRMAFADAVESMILGASGIRMYGVTSPFQEYNSQYVSATGAPGGWAGTIAPSVANSFVLNTQGLVNQLWSHPNVENHYSVPDFWANSNAGLMWSRLAPLDFQVKLNSPDYGWEWDCGAHGGAQGGLLVCGNFTNGTETRTLSLGTCESYGSGGSVFEYIFDYKGKVGLSTLSSSLSTVTVSLPEGEAVAIACPQHSSHWLNRPTISVNLGDVSTASDIVIQFSYDPYDLDTANNTYDCRSTLPCEPPWDRNIGTIYYRLIYRNSNGVVLARSDVQTL